MQYLKNKLWHPFIAWIGSKLYKNPSRKLFVIGITGTKGKSSTIELLGNILESAGKKSAALSTVQKRIGEQVFEKKNANTMPGRMAIQHFLHQAAKAGCKYAIVEVTSQGVVQNRHKHIDYDAAALTGLHPEHIESHGSFENYKQAKVNFFRYVANQKRKTKALFFINLEDEQAQAFQAAAAMKGKVVDFSGSWLLNKRLNGYNDLGPWFENNFNLSNAALATAIAESVGAGWETIHQALRGFKGVPGRMETFTGKSKASGALISVVLDYAHTPGSLEAVYSFLRAKHPKEISNLIAVLGSTGGGRDRWKRPEHAKIAEKYCQQIFLTSEDPYDEDPKTIIEEMKQGMKNPDKAKVIIDRKEAIEQAIKEAKEGDVVIITGIGSQNYFYGPKGSKLPWSEKEIIKNCLI
ncbi:MAG: UDP-N-acetylmuramyl-tripeptide synthetase [bacterium]|nr:UDP-N-acetylmuramyl-tripeptide synthetase [bacterium]